ncbi:hypothetical protein F8M41_020888 [Gigaspora margarita]|uniref:Uncharacterized protein n=1 Tax=Gigaspora margarita TaxID=4874 RepID=A0A8H4AHQ0_GIGMA|nr:hypothetical protein F8M41_020888 [Gigaspora margarita]
MPKNKLDNTNKRIDDINNIESPKSTTQNEMDSNGKRSNTPTTRETSQQQEQHHNNNEKNTATMTKEALH